MARVFNICFRHAGSSYTALVYVSGNKEDDTSVKVTSNDETIQILLPNGRLIFPITEVLQRLFSAQQKDPEHATVYVTENISLQLLK